MNSNALFAMALGIEAPWHITSIDFKTAAPSTDKPITANNAIAPDKPITHLTHLLQELHLTIGFTPGTKFNDAAGIPSAVHDTVERTWQHLNFFQHRTYIHGKVPRIKTSEGKVCNVSVPWARAGSGFTLLFEAFALALIEREMPVCRVAEIMGVYPQRIWTLFEHWVSVARANDDPSAITRLGVDETSSKRGHHYVTVGVDLDAARVIHAVEGKDKETLSQIAAHLSRKGVAPAQINEMSMDLSPAFIAGAKASFPAAKITFDRFHVVKLLNGAMDSVRKAERGEHAALKGHKYTFLTNQDALPPKRRAELEAMIILYPTLGVAYRLKTLFNDLWAMPDKASATASKPIGV